MTYRMNGSHELCSFAPTSLLRTLQRLSTYSLHVNGQARQKLWGGRERKKEKKKFKIFFFFEGEGANGQQREEGNKEKLSSATTQDDAAERQETGKDPRAPRHHRSPRC